MIELQQDEQVQRIIRRYWLTLTPQLVMGIFFFWLPPALLFLAIDPRFSFISYFLSYLKIGMMLYYLIFLCSLFYVWMDYYLDITIITNQRILLIEQKGLFNRQVTSVPRDKIQDITVRKRGVLQTFFDFGDIQLQTAGEENYSMKDVFQPNEAKNYLLTKPSSSLS